MRRVKCVNNHFFDMERFSSCPTCGVAPADSVEVPDKSTPTESPVTKPLLQPVGLDRPEDEMRIAPSAGKARKKVKCINGHFFDMGRFSSCPSCGAVPIESLRTSDKEDPDPGDSKTGWLCLGFPSPDPTDVDDNPCGKYPPEQERKLNDGDSPAQGDTQTENIPEKDSLADAVEATSSKKAGVSPKTTAYYDVGGVEPPVGWLICIRGTYIGRTFECRAGRNRIGRNLDMDICLSEDLSISGDFHAAIIYEPQNRIFYLQDGGKRGLTYHNGKMIHDHQELHAYDRIELGKTEFLFFPLCGENFTWDDYMEKG